MNHDIASLDPKHLLLSTGSCGIAGAADGDGTRAIVNVLLAGPAT